MAKPALAANDYEAEESDTGAAETDEHERLLRQFDAVAMAEQDERAAALEDRRFVSIAGAQWEGDWGDQFENSIKVEIDKTGQGVERIMDQYRANRPIVNFRAVDKGASEETAETLNGMFRADHYRSGGKEITDAAVEEGVQGGYGAWRLTNELVDPYDPDNDQQQITTLWIPEADQAVYWVGGKTYTKRDAKGCYVISALTPDEFDEAHPDAGHDSWPEGFPKPVFDWFLPDVIRVAEYYEVEEQTANCRYYEHVATGERRKEFDLTGAESEALVREGWKLLKVRRVKRRRVSKTVLSGCEVLKPKRYIAGTEIPVVPVYGKRRFVDGVERVRGHVRKAKDAQRVYNSQISKLTETAALAPQERPIFTPEQIAGHENSWAESNINRSPYALINQVIDASSGQPIPMGAVGKIEPPQLSPVMGALIQITANDIKEMTSSDDAAAEVKSNVSADAMEIAATRIDDKAFTYIDNAEQSWARYGEIWLSMARDVYVEEGREVETVDAEGKSPATATLAEPFTDDHGNFSVRNDIAAGKYKVISDVTEATTTRRDKTVRTLFAGAQAVAQFDPDTAQAMNITAVLNMDGEGMTDLQDYLRKKALGIGLVKPTPEEEQELAEQAKAAKPDPQVAVVEGQAHLAEAAAVKEGELAKKAVADTALSEAKRVETLASAHAKSMQAHATHSAAHEQRKQGMFDRFASLFGSKPKGK